MSLRLNYTYFFQIIWNSNLFRLLNHLPTGYKKKKLTEKVQKGEKPLQTAQKSEKEEVKELMQKAAANKKTLDPFQY